MYWFFRMNRSEINKLNYVHDSRASARRRLIDLYIQFVVKRRREERVLVYRVRWALVLSIMLINWIICITITSKSV